MIVWNVEHASKVMEIDTVDTGEILHGIKKKSTTTVSSSSSSSAKENKNKLTKDNATITNMNVNDDCADENDESNNQRKQQQQNQEQQPSSAAPKRVVVHCAIVHTDPHILIGACSDNLLRFWDVSTGQILCSCSSKGYDKNDKDDNDDDAGMNSKGNASNDDGGDGDDAEILQHLTMSDTEDVLIGRFTFFLSLLYLSLSLIYFCLTFFLHFPYNIYDKR
jgi:hypothetical protein